MLGSQSLTRKVIGDWLQAEESNGSRYSRDNIVVKGGQGILITGTVLGRIAVGAAVGSMSLDNAGNGTIGPVAVSAGAQLGIYRIDFTSPTAFDVRDPSGDLIDSGAVGTEFSHGGLKFTIAAGAEAFTAADAGAITVDPGSGHYTQLTPGGAGGAEVAAGILIEDVDTSQGDVAGAALRRHAHIAESGLTWGATVTDAQKAAALGQLAQLGILQVREA